MWLGLLNSRCTFIIDHDGIVRGMCEGIFDGIGHRKFAERWLVRIEHELADRTRDVSVDKTTNLDFFKPMTKEEVAGLRVKHGSENSASGGGIDRAPRYGAAPMAGELGKRKKRSVRHFLSLHSASDGQPPHISTVSKHAANALVGAHGGAEFGSSQGSDQSSTSLPLSRGNSVEKQGSLGRKSLLRLLGGRRDILPPVPPVYENLDEKLQMYGVADASGEAGVVVGCALASSHSAGSHRDWERAATRSSGSAGSRNASLSQTHARNASGGSSSKSARGHSSKASNGPHLSIKPHVSDFGVATTVPNRSELALSPVELFTQRSTRPQAAETGDLSQGTAGPKSQSANAAATRSKVAMHPANLTRRSRDAPDGIPLDADSETTNDTEEFVTQLVNGTIDLSSRPRHESNSLSSARDWIEHGSVAAERRKSSDSGIASAPTATSLTSSHFSTRATSRRPTTSSSSTSSRPPSSLSGQSRQSAETIRPSGHQTISRAAHRDVLARRASHESFGRVMPTHHGNGLSTPTALGIPPSQSLSQSSYQTPEPESEPSGDRNSLDASNGSQITAAKRLIIRKDPVSPRRLLRSGSVGDPSGSRSATPSPRSVQQDATQPVRVQSSKSALFQPVPSSRHVLPATPLKSRRLLSKQSDSSSSGSSYVMNGNDPSSLQGLADMSPSAGSIESFPRSTSGSVVSFAGDSSSQRPSEASSVISVQSTGTFGPRRPSLET